MNDIVTPRLRLRRARPGDLDDMHAVLSDPAAMRYWSTPPHVGRDETERWLNAMIAAAVEESDDYVIEKAGRVIGKAGCYAIPEIGFILRSDQWRQGLADEALRAVVPVLFANHRIDALVADVDPRNAASLRLLDRLGFRETHRASRTLLVGDEWCDSIYLALPRPG